MVVAIDVVEIECYFCPMREKGLLCSYHSTVIGYYYLRIRTCNMIVLVLV